MTGGLVLDIVLLLLLGSYAASGYRQGLLVSGLSLVGFLGGGAVGMTVLPQRFAGWSWAKSARRIGSPSKPRASR